MADFFGHAIPGFILILFSLSCLMDILICYFKPRQNARGYQSRIFQYVSCCRDRRQISLSAWFMVITTIIGLLFEAVYFDADVDVRVHHATIYIVYCLHAAQALVQDLLPPLPERRQLEYSGYVIALSVMALLFIFHLHGRPKQDVAMHMFLVNTLITAVIVTLVELWQKNNVILALGRSYLAMLQGTWFFQLGYTLYNPWRKSQEEHNNAQLHQTSDMAIMTAATLFCWHMITLFVLYVIIFLAFHLRFGSKLTSINRHDNSE